ncbi:hypothetical protein, variant 2 [Exophiala mesophila]|nr:hypothetical protein, variant 1 [Exophiala mesophila]XP_016221129.1 hypothetical protein, variant 2 [Exophiala mesophila]KIV89554.1 hypothetical protein, variant 1 [Exophiala mesophila]KIV89555.1 hypothetical protein, variant 2 [Exophiala mesophila]
MTKDFGLPDASFYAGILVASFSLSEAAFSMLWGHLSDRVGRKPVLLFGCFGTIVSLMMVGFSSNFTVALVGRVLGGALNGNIGVIQTMVGELVKVPSHEPKAYAIMPFVWSVGTILGPAIGGLLASPANNYPAAFSPRGLFGQFPYLLPNLVCSVLMLVSILAGYLFLQETHPDFQAGADPNVHHTIAEQTHMIPAAGTNADSAIDLRRDSYGTFNEVSLPRMEQWQVSPDGSSRPNSISEKTQPWLTRKVATLTIALALFTFHSMCYDHLLPIFFQDESVNQVSVLAASPVHIPGGLGLTVQTVGIIMAVNGVIALFMQAVVFPIAAEWLAIWRLFICVTILHPVAYFIVPYLALLPENLVLPGVYFCLTVRNLFAILVFPLLLILRKQASPSPSSLGRINGLAASAGAASRSVAPPAAGLLYGWGSKIGFMGLAYWGAGAVAVVGAIQLWSIPREKHESTVIKSVLPCLESSHPNTPADTVDVVVVETGNRV